MATYSFEDDSITNLPTAGDLHTETTPGDTYNPFAAAVVNSGDDVVSVVINLYNENDALLDLKLSDGITTINQDDVDGLGFSGTAAQVQDWLRSLYITGSNATDSFLIALTGGTDPIGYNLSYEVTLSGAPCFLKGTLIATPGGERAVETLMPGDLVTVLDGSARKVKWIGHRTYEAEFGANEAFVRPVVFKAGSLGDGLPVRDLKVSPQHGMLIDGAMVPAAALVNGVSILRDEVPGDVSYFHIELDSHEAIFAEGAPTETFVDHDSRAMFDNADEYNLLYGTASARPVEQPRLEEGFGIAAIRRRLAGIAGISAPASAGPMMGNLERIEDGVLHGWVVDAAGAEAVEAEVLVDGETVARIVANRYRADLDQAGIAGGRGGFTVALPPSAVSLEQVSLRRVVNGEVLAAPATETAGA